MWTPTALLAQQRETSVHTHPRPQQLLVGAGASGAAAAAPPPVQLTVHNSPAPPLPVEQPQTAQQLKIMHDYESWLEQEQQVRPHRGAARPGAGPSS